MTFLKTILVTPVLMTTNAWKYYNSAQRENLRLSELTSLTLRENHLESQRPTSREVQTERTSLAPEFKVEREL